MSDKAHNGIVAVVGGTGTLGREVASVLAARGRTVRIVSRSAPSSSQGSSRASSQTPSRGTWLEHRVADLLTGQGLDEALDGVGSVVDTINAGRGASHVLVDGTRRLLDAEARAGVQHHVGISIVGCDRVNMSYYRVKTMQEGIVQSGGVPWSLLRATQFHTLIESLFRAASRAYMRPTGRFLFQPVDPREVAERLSDAVDSGPSARLPDIGGPRIQSLTELGDLWRESRRRHLLPVRLGIPGALGGLLRDGALCAGADAGAGIGFAEWLNAND